MYHGFSGNHIKVPAVHTKSEPFDSEADDRLKSKDIEGHAGMSQKRARQGSLGASLSSDKAAKLLRMSPSPEDLPTASATASIGHALQLGQPESGPDVASPPSMGIDVGGMDPAISAPSPSTSPPRTISHGATSQHSLSDVPDAPTPDQTPSGATEPTALSQSSSASTPGPNPDNIDDVHSIAALSPRLVDSSVTSPSASLGPHTAISSGAAVTSRSGRGTAGTVPADEQSDERILSERPSHHPEAVIVPVKKPFADPSGSRRRSSRLTYSGPESGDPPPNSDMADTERSQAAGSSTTSSTPDTLGAAVGPPSVPSAMLLSKKRTQKGAIVLAKAKYKPDVISEQMLFMRRMVAADPAVTHTAYMDAFKRLTSEEHEQLKKECVQERKQKRNQQGGTGCAEP
ncbi:hypothetical protein OH77DRAFT_1423030 [Trametes cingulata]|nr:hypothetical protein OH77DRAFT_1423030 [Trametes cingulata]